MADDFFTRQLPHNVTWALTLLYALDSRGEFSDTAVQVRQPCLIASAAAEWSHSSPTACLQHRSQLPFTAGKETIFSHTQWPCNATCGHLMAVMKSLVLHST